MLREEGIEIQPLVAKNTFDRKGFEVTKKNFAKREVDSFESYEEFEWCFPLPLGDGGDKNSDDLQFSKEQVQEHILKCCIARRTDVHHEAFDDIKALSTAYCFSGRIDKGMSKNDFVRMITKTFTKWLKSTGCETKHVKAPDGKTVYVLAKLEEEAAKRIADRHMYPVQMDRHVTQFKEFKSDPEFVPPFHAYERSMEERGAPVGSMKTIGRIWMRYDRLSQVVKKEHFNRDHQELSCFRDVDRLRLLQYEINRHWNMEFMEKQKFCSKAFPLHQGPNKVALQREWANFRNVWHSEQPLDQIRNYYGEELAMYFAFMGFYTKALAAPAVLGLLLFILQQIFDKDLQFNTRWLNVCRVIYCVFIAGWVTWFFQHWLRKERQMRVCWGVEISGVRRPPEERPNFKGDGWMVDPIHPPHFVKYQNVWKLRAREAITFGVTSFATVFSIILVNNDLTEALMKTMGFEVKSGIQESIENFSKFFLLSRFVSLAKDIAAFAMAILIKFLDKIWSKLCVYPLTSFENQQFQQKHSDSASMKLYCFKFFDNFSMLFYLAFFKDFFQPCDDVKSGRCLLSLRRQLFSLFFVGILGNLKELGSPIVKYAYRKCRRHKQLRDNQHLTHVDLLEKQFLKKGYDGRSGIVGDWLEVMIQFGLLTLFSLVMPLIPAVAYVANLVEIRSDAFKITNIYRRPFPREAGDIGYWQNVVRSMGFLAVICNIFLCVFATVGRERTVTFKLVLCLVMMLIALVLREFIQQRVPSESEETGILRARMHAVTSEAVWGDEHRDPQGKQLQKKHYEKKNSDKLEFELQQQPPYIPWGSARP